MAGEIEALIFDMDGVIADTVELHYRAWNRLLREEGIPFDRAVNERLRGLSRHDSLKLLFAGRPLDERRTEALMARKNGYFHEELAAMTPADRAPGLDALLAEARAAGLKLGLASSSRNVGAVLDRLALADAFDAIGDGYTVINAKPAPDVFLWVAGRLNVTPPRALVLEDAEAGVAAALHGGFRVIGVGDPAIVGKADAVFPSLAGVTLAVLLAVDGVT
jgi:beta-phosphoglucomutase